MDDFMEFTQPADKPDAAVKENQLFTVTDPDAETVVAILPVDDAWAALAWMQQGSYMYHAVPLLAAARDLAKRYGARPVLATSDAIGFKVTKPKKTSGDEIIELFQTLGATTINDVETPSATLQVTSAKEWLVWWD